MLTDGAKAVVWDADYRPFGEATVAGALAFNLRFPGQYHDDETEYYYNHFRTYDPTSGRYLESDPIGLRGGWNTYAYVGGNPVRFVDPWGLIADPPGGAGDQARAAMACVVAKALLRIFCHKGALQSCDLRKTKYQKLSCDEIAHRYDRFQTCLTIRQSITNLCHGGVPDPKHETEEQGLRNGAKNVSIDIWLNA